VPITYAAYENGLPGQKEKQRLCETGKKENQRKQAHVSSGTIDFLNSLVMMRNEQTNRGNVKHKSKK